MGRPGLEDEVKMWTNWRVGVAGGWNMRFTVGLVWGGGYPETTIWEKEGNG